MTVKLTDKVYNEGGAPVQGAVAQAILTNGTSSSIVATDTTDTKGIWAFDTSIAGHQADLADPAAGYWYDVRINMGMQYRLRYGAIKAMMSMVYLAQTIQLGASQIFDASVARFRVPVKAADPSSPGSGEFLLRSDTKYLRVYDGTAWLDIGDAPPEEVYAGATVNVSSNYTVAPGVMFVFVTGAGVTVTLPAATSNRPIWVSPNFNTSVTVNSASGGVYGGTFHPTTGAVQNGLIQSGASAMEAVTYKADGSNWRAV
jgi:hypothetical protein